MADENLELTWGRVHSEETLQRLAEVPDVYARHAMAAMLEASLLLEREVKDRAPTGVGGAAGLRGSIAAMTPFMDGDTLSGGVSTSSPYVEPVELGSKPHFPPIRPLMDWVKAKLNEKDPKEAYGIALCIARKISWHGTEGKFFFKAALENSQSKVEAIFDSAIEKTLNGGAE